MPHPIISVAATVLLLLIAALTLTSPTHAAAAPPTDPAGRTLQHTVVLAAPIEEVWQTLTTADGWKRGFGVAHAEIDLRPGGKIRTHYDPAGTLGDDNTIINTILAYEPGRMLAMKATAPAAAPPFIKHICEHGWSVIRLDPLTPDRTRLTITGMGYGDTELDHQAYAFFDQGNTWSLKMLQDHFADPADDESTAAAERLMRRLLGDWAFSITRPDGSTFRGTTSCTEHFGGKLIHATGALGNERALTPHSHFLAARDPRSGAYTVWNFSDAGDYTEGRARAAADNKLILDWNTWSAKTGAMTPYRVEYTFTSDDAFILQIFRPAQDNPNAMERMTEVTYTRTAPTAGNP